MKDSEHNEETTARSSADAGSPAEPPQTEEGRQDAVTTRTRDHLPPILLTDGSFVVEIRERLSPPAPSGSTARPHKYTTVHILRRIMIIDGHGDVLYKNIEAETCEVHIWLLPHQPNDPPQVIFRDGSAASPPAFEIDREFESPDQNPISKFRPFVYKDPRGDDVNFFVYRVRVVKAGEIIFQFIADVDHPEGLQIWIWDRRL
jgi:hypothetical protein